MARIMSYENGRTEYHANLWWNRFNNFMSVTLGKPETCPTGADVERFIETVVLRTKGLRGLAPSYNWLQRGLQVLVRALEFHHPDFEYGKHARAHVHACIADHLKDGRITRDQKIHRKWASILVVEHLVRSYVQRSLDCGTKCWDIVISNVLLIVLMGCLGCRVGDILRGSRDRNKRPYICYSDVEIRYKTPSSRSINDLLAVFTIRNEKGWKFNNANNRQVIVEAQSDSELDILDPIKLVLILALRTGNVLQTNISDLLEITRKRRSRTIQWVDGDKPLIPQIGTNGVCLNVDLPAPTPQLNRLLARECGAAGLVDLFRSHDIRRGHFRAVAHLPTPVQGVASLAVAKVGGHSLRGNLTVSDLYVGDPDDDVYAKKLTTRAKPQDRMHPIKLASQAYKPTRASGEEIDEACRAEGLDPSDAKARNMVASRCRKRKLEEWAQEEERKRHDVAPALKKPRPEPRGYTADDDEENEGSVDDNHESGADDDQEPSDEALATAAKIQSQIAGFSDDDDEEGSGETIWLAGMTAKAATGTIVAGDGLAFVEKFSRINLTNVSVLYKRPHVVQKNSGGSRDAMKPFPEQCVNAPNGCMYVSDNRENRRLHEKRCKITTKGAVPSKTFACTHPTCEERFAGQEEVAAHFKRVHRGYPKICRPQECGFIAQDAREMERHNEAVHRTVEGGITCKVPGCKSIRKFNTTTSYRRHLKNIHKLAAKDQKQYQ